MKAMKYVGLVTLATVALGFATPASATVSNDQSTVEVTVNSSDVLFLKSVPSGYNFVTTINENETYADLEAQKAAGALDLGDITVIRGYKGTKEKQVSVTLGNLKITRGEDEVVVDDTVTNTSFTFGDTAGKTTFLDSEFGASEDTGKLTKSVDKLKLSFKTSNLQVGDKVTGTLTYQVNNVTTY